MDKYEARAEIRELIECRMWTYQHVNGFGESLREFAESLLTNECFQSLYFQDFNDGVYYLGNIRNGKREGYGIVRYERGRMYIGEWSNDVRNGEGFDIQQNFCYHGYFVDGEYQGIGTMVGEGLHVSADFNQGKIVSVRYSNGGFTFNGKHYKGTTGNSGGGSSSSGDSGSSCLGFIIIIAIIWGCFKFCGNCSSSSNSHNNTEISQATSTYICTARKSLKVRTSPSTSASQMGSIMSGEEVEVYSISNGFAKVRFNGDIGYASSKYLKRK